MVTELGTVQIIDPEPPTEIEPPEPDTAPDVVVVEAPEPAESPWPTIVAMTRQIAGLEDAMTGVIARLAETEVTAEIAMENAADASNIAVDNAGEIEELSPVVTELATESLGNGPDDGDKDESPDSPPKSARRHWVFRAHNEWRE